MAHVTFRRALYSGESLHRRDYTVSLLFCCKKTLQKLLKERKRTKRARTLANAAATTL